MKDKILKGVFMLLWLVNVFYVFREWMRDARIALDNPASFGCSEFLINYQGGFVRRGLLGEILYSYCHSIDCDPRYIIVTLCCLSFIVCCGVLLFVLRQLKACYWMVPTYYMLFGSELIRKDFLIFSLSLAAVYLYKKITYPHLRGIAATALILVVLNIHEAAFFYAVPMYFFVMFSDSCKGITLVEKVFHAVVIIMMMVLLCLCKGSADIAESITRSWQFIYPEQYACLHTNAIGSLTWGIDDATRLHLKFNYIMGDIPYLGLLMRPMALLVILFLMARVTLAYQWENNRRMVEKFIYISVLHLMALLPMLTILSCDFRRVVSYWTLSSLFTLFFLRESEIIGMRWPLIGCFIRVGHRVIGVYSSRRAVCLLILVFSIPYAGNSLISYYSPLLVKCRYFVLLLLQ